MLEIKSLSKTYGSGEKATLAIGDLTFAVRTGEFVVHRRALPAAARRRCSSASPACCGRPAARCCCTGAA